MSRVAEVKVGLASAGPASEEGTTLDALAIWVQRARAAATQGPAQPRLPLWVAGQPVGSVQTGFLDKIALESAEKLGFLLLKNEFEGQAIWQLQCAPAQATQALNALALALRTAGRCGPWRNEQLRVGTLNGDVVGTVERGAARPLGLATRAVHLVGTTANGHQWVQKRATNKPNNPGLWDTLMGGMVSAADTLAQALARETWEEAGLRLAALQQLEAGGFIDFARPSREAGGAGYKVERIDWYCAVLPDGLEPCNQDGEVECFALWSPQQVRAAVAAGQFTQPAGLVLAQFYGW